MKSKFNRILSVVAITLIAVCASANSASAQSAYKGTFTLTQEARWGSAKLPARFTKLLKKPGSMYFWTIATNGRA